MKITNLFGEEVEPPQPKQPKRGREPYKTMQERHGEFKGFTCGQCEYRTFYRAVRKANDESNIMRQGSDEQRESGSYKCRVWTVSSSTATDIRLKNIACRKFKYKEVEKC